MHHGPASNLRGSGWAGQWGPFQAVLGRHGNMRRNELSRAMTGVLDQEQEKEGQWNVFPASGAEDSSWWLQHLLH